MTSYFSPIFNDFRGWNWKETVWLFLALFIVGVGSIAATPLEFFAALFNVVCVILVAKGRISNYYWGLLGVILYAIVAYKQQFYGNAALNVIYIAFQFWGVYEWRKSLDKRKVPYFEFTTGKHRGIPRDFSGSEQRVHTAHAIDQELDAEIIVRGKSDVEVKRLGWIGLCNTMTILCFGTLGVSIYLSRIGDPAPVLDAFTLVASLVAQTLMVKRYSEQWILWILVNVASIYMWVIPALGQPGSWAMVAMWSVFFLNSLLGMWKWFLVKFNK